MSNAASKTVPSKPVDDAPLPSMQPRVEQTLGNLLLSAAFARPSADACVFPGERLRYRDLAAWAWRVARALWVLGVRPRQHVGVLMTNSPESIVSLFGVALLGAVVVPLNTRYRPSELRFLCGDAKLAAILVSGRDGDRGELAQLVADALPELARAADPGALAIEAAPQLRAVVVFGSEGRAGMLAEAAFDALAAGADHARVARSAEAVALRDVAAIVYSLGTASVPNGVVLTHEALVRGWTTVGRQWQIGADDRLWSPCPLSHLSGLGPLICTLAHGATYVSDRFFDAARALELIAAERVTMLHPLYPPIAEALLESPRFGEVDLSRVKLWLVVAPMQPLKQLARALPRARLISTYGTPESGPITMHDPADEFDVRLATYGRALPGVEIRIVDRDTQAELPAGRTGEIVYRGANSFSGYYNEPERTAAVIDADGWVHPGDLGMLDDEDRLVFHRRLDEAAALDGAKTVPAEIEDFLGAHPAVKAVQVVAIPEPSVVEAVAAFVELHEHAEATEDELIAYCRAHVSSFRVPQLVRFVNQWPSAMTNGRRQALRERLVRELMAEPAMAVPRGSRARGAAAEDFQ
ncbi:AMP-binding protein [Aromatoleum toluclasticum]|uniref:class I adenylate-forming enzyme family protein n=1 Tax=Aromatoleum toluclasticum TaxID=92003 RepID=UPI001D1822DB|nr:AMP-binding protein [Aromatoleum toluclasticum]MCC4114740.1 AMP-binding protein [Aromatoleum toluclasticum]